ncbi:MAG: chorismate synthase [Clostridiales bacterium]|nr:chorismate synthase [Clostridiales bacterium]
MSSSFGTNFKVQVFGQSHSEMLGAVIDGLPAGFAPDMERIQTFLKRRQGGQNAWSTLRAEADIPRIVSGLSEGRTCGAPLCVLFENKDAKSADYEPLRFIPRPSHADCNAHVKYGGAADPRGGGHFSGRLTLPLCFAGALCLQILEGRGIRAQANAIQIGAVKGQALNQEMLDAIAAAAAEGDSLGGIIECTVTGLPQGLGEPMFDGLENRIAAAVFAIPAVRGIEFGAGFAAAAMRGSQHNDPYGRQDGQVRPLTNHAGGVLGGIATGLPLIFRAAIKPTPSIAKEQDSVNLQTGENVKLCIGGRHDPCIVPRALPCVETAAAIAILDLILKG